MHSLIDGWRARIGIVYPASGLADMEYFHLCPPGVSVHLTRSSVPNGGGVTLADVLEVAEGRQFADLAGDLSTIRPSSIAWMCTSGSFSRGTDWDGQLIRTLAEHGGCPATTAATAMVEALRVLGARRIGVAAPYEEAVLRKLVDYLGTTGFSVASAVGLGLTLDWDINNLSPMELVDLVWRADHADADALFVSDTCIVLSPFVAALEADLGKPVVSANMATMWHALRLAGVHEPQAGLGALFAGGAARGPP